MHCLQCQFENREGVRFCEQCGAKLEQTCPACGSIVPPDRKFCGGCGQPLASPQQVATKFSSPEVYTPKHLAEKILTSKSALEGERKQVTVLFADMKGSMELLADRDPEEARKLLDPVIEHMMEAVHRYEGTVNHVMGDGIMALFGAPLAHEDHAVRACYAALECRSRSSAMLTEFSARKGVPIQIRVGLNSGEVVVACHRERPADGLHRDRTDDTFGGAHGADGDAGIGSDDALTRYDLAEGYVQVKPLGPVAVKGMSEPVEVYEVTGAGAARTRLQAAAARGLTRFVGRDAETEQLRKALEQARAGPRSGGCGSRVSRASESRGCSMSLCIRIAQRDGLIVESGSVSYGKATPYLPVIDLLKAYFKIHDRDNQRDMREKVTGKLLTLDKSSGARAAGVAVALGCRGGRSAMAELSIRPSAASAPWTRSSVCCCARAKFNRCSWSSRICTGSIRRPSRSWTA